MVGRKRVYWLVAAIMIAGALGSALSPSFWVLIGFRFVLGFGVGGDYPVSAVMMSEYANRKDRGKLVGMVFGTQALGLIVGPLIALALLGAGASDDVAWRVLLGLGAVPAAAVIYLRCRMPESPRYQAQVQGRAEQAASQIAGFTGGRSAATAPPGRAELGLRAFLTNRRWLVMLAGTAGCWFLLDYAYYGNTISTPQILGLISPHASTMTKIALQLAIFVVAAVPGYVLAIARLDRIGHRRLQLDRVRGDGPVLRRHRGGTGHDHHGGAVPAGVRGELLLHRVRPEHDHLRPAQRAVPGDHAGHRARHLGRDRQARRVHRGLPVPGAATSLGLRGTLLLTAGVSVLGFALTLVLPEPAGRSLDDMPPARPPVPRPLRTAEPAWHPHRIVLLPSTCGVTSCCVHAGHARRSHHRERHSARPPRSSSGPRPPNRDLNR